MQIIKFLAIAVFLTAGTCQAKSVIATSGPDNVNSDFVKDLVNIVTSCSKDRINGVGLGGKLPDALIRTLSVQHLIPITLMDDTSHMINATVVQLAPGQFRYQLQVFIVGASSWEQLGNTIQFIIKTSIWWNHMASFIIVDESPRCDNSDYLFLAWQLDLLNAKVICYHRYERPRVIFSYNPFTSQAPRSWRRVHAIPGINQHPFTIFMRRLYLGNDVKCVDLDFVKTRNLGGYKINVHGKQEDLEVANKNFPRSTQIWASRKRVLYTIYDVLNATPRFSGKMYGSKTSGEDMDVRDGMASHLRRTSYPYQRMGVIIVSKFAGHKSQLEKILSVTDVESRIGMGIVYLLTLIFFKFLVHQSLVQGILNLVRMTCNTGFTHLSDNTAPRLYLTGLLFFVVTMQGIYQGNLASLLTNAVPYKNVNSIKDLENRDSMIYGDKILAFLLKDSSLQERFVITDDPFECVRHVVNDLSAVCLTFADGVTLDLARRHDLHLSNEFITQVPMGTPIRPSWYLEEQINIMFGKIMEADIFETWEAKCSPYKLADYEFDKEVLKNTDYKILELKEVLFAFIILGIGLACATVTFIVEVAIYRN